MPILFVRRRPSRMETVTLLLKPPPSSGCCSEDQAHGGGEGPGISITPKGCRASPQAKPPRNWPTLPCDSPLTKGFALKKKRTANQHGKTPPTSSPIDERQTKQSNEGNARSETQFSGQCADVARPAAHPACPTWHRLPSPERKLRTTSLQPARFARR